MLVRTTHSFDRSEMFYTCAVSFRCTGESTVGIEAGMLIVVFFQGFPGPIGPPGTPGKITANDIQAKSSLVRSPILGRNGYPGLRGEKGLPGIPGKTGREGTTETLRLADAHERINF